MPSFFRAKGVLILMLISVPMAIIALLVKFTSPGPIFFVQRRYGLHGNEIPVIKLRSMGVMEDGDDVTQVKDGDMREAVGRVFPRDFTRLDSIGARFVRAKPAYAHARPGCKGGFGIPLFGAGHTGKGRSEIDE